MDITQKNKSAPTLQALDKARLSRLRKLIKELPDFCQHFFVGIESSTSILTRLNYAHDLKVFFNYLIEEDGKFKDYSMSSFSLDDIGSLSPFQIEQFLSYTTYYINENGYTRDNGEAGKERKLSCLRSFFKYFLKRGSIENNPAALVDSPRRLSKQIVRLEPNEVTRLLNFVENGDCLTEREKKYHAKTKVRDLAILTLLLGTGIRVSECVGLNLGDFDFDDYSFRVTRKGGDVVLLYFGDEVFRAVSAYYDQRKKAKAETGHENALFLSLQNRRMTARSIENLVKKFAQHATPLKKISPHKLRSTFGTQLYNETEDIYLVADVLGHSDVNTTRKHYAAQSDENRRAVSRKIKLRDD
ncbi:MAG: tyrosine-type recombinase/integrase [Christensenellales bacterium]|jgi:integrase/recombinase XerC